MAGILRKVFGETERDVAPAVQHALDELERDAVQRPSFADAMRVVGDLLPLLFPAHLPNVYIPNIARDEVIAKVPTGLPLLRGLKFQLNAKVFQTRWLAVCDVIARRQQDATAKQLGDSMRKGQLHAEKIMRYALDGDSGTVRACAEQLGLDAQLTCSVLRLALFPELTRISAAISPMLSGLEWRRGYCPLCGSWPLLGEFRGLEQLRYLRCGMCAADWEFSRLMCPYCETRDHSLLGYFHVEGEEAKQRVATCENCRGYVKMVSTLSALDPPHLLVADVTTMHLDLAAREREYQAQI